MATEAHRKYKLNEHYLDEIDTPNKAYILGFFMADGYNNEINKSLRLILNQKDIDILYKINREFDSNCPIKKYRTKSKDKYKDRELACLQINSKYLSEKVKEYGLIKNKTFQIKFPNFLKKDLYSHYIRGYFDGDGWVSYNENNNRIYAGIIGNLQFSNGLINFLGEQNIYFHINHIEGKPNNVLCRTSNKKEIKKFYDFLYRDCDLYLFRKKEIFEIMFEKNKLK